MYAVKINTKHNDRPKIENGESWVKSATHPYYVTKKERGMFATKEDAISAIQEPWEMVVFIKS